MRFAAWIRGLSAARTHARRQRKSRQYREELFPNLFLRQLEERRVLSVAPLGWNEALGGLINDAGPDALQATSQGDPAPPAPAPDNTITAVFNAGALDFTGDTGNDALTLNFQDATGAVVEYDIGAGTVQQGGVTSISFDGDAGDNAITINGSGDPDTLSVDGDQIDYGAVPITLIDVQSRTIDAGAGNDTLTVLGRDGDDDTTTIAPDLALGNDFFVEIDPTLLKVYGKGFETLNVTTGVEAGGDSISLTPLATVAVNIDGQIPGSGLLPAGDSLSVDVSGAAGAVDMAVTSLNSGEITDPGGAFQPVTYTDIEILDVPAGAVNVILDADADAIAPGGVDDKVDDDFLIQLNAAKTDYEIFVNGVALPLLPVGSVESVLFNGSRNDHDTLTVNNANGLVVLPQGIHFDGEFWNINAAPDPEPAVDSLIIQGDPATTIKRETFVTGAAVPAVFGGPLGVDEGVVILDPDDTTGPGTVGARNGDEQFVKFLNLMPVISVTPVDQFDMFATPLDDQIDIEDGIGFGGFVTTELTADNLEPIEFANKKTVSVNGMDGDDTITVINPNRADGLTALNIYGNELTDGTINAVDNGANDFLEVHSIGAAVTAGLFGQAGDDQFSLGTGLLGARSLDGVLGSVVVDGGTTGDDRLSVIDGFGTADASITLTDTAIGGMGPVGATFSYFEIEGLFLDTADGASSTLNVTGTALGTTTEAWLSTGGVASTVNVGVGDMDAVLGSFLVLNAGGAVTMQVDDTADITADTGAIDVVGADTLITGLGPAAVGYRTGAVAVLEVSVGSGANNIDVQATTATTSTQVNAGAGPGTNTITIDGDNLTADNRFVGATGDDRFVLNVTTDLGGTALTIESNDLADQDSLEINDLGAVGRNLTFTYPTPISDPLEITGLAIAVDVQKMQTVTYTGDGANDDQLTVEASDGATTIQVAPTGLDSADMTIEDGGVELNLSLAGLHADNGLTINGKPGNADTLRYDNSTTAQLDFTAPSAGTITEATSITVNYNEVEFIESVDSLEVVVDAGAGKDDATVDEFLVELDAATGAQVEITVDAQLIGSINLAAVDNILFNGSGDVGTLTVRSDNGLVTAPNGIHFEAGGSNADTLILEGNPQGTLEQDTYAAGLAADAGSILVVAAGGDEQAVTFTNLESIQDTMPVDRLDILATPAIDQINIVDGGLVGGFVTTEVNADNLTRHEFARKTTAVVNGFGGADVVSINNPNSAAELSNLEVHADGSIQLDGAIDLAGYLTLKTNGVAGQDPTASITADGLELLGAGTFTLDDPANDVNTIAAATDGTIRFRDQNQLLVGTVPGGGTTGITTAGDDVRLHTGGALGINAPVNLQGANLTIESDDAVTQTQPIIAGGLELLGLGHFTLTNAGNNITTLAGDTVGSIRFQNQNGFQVGTVTGDGSVGITATELTIQSPAAVTQTQPISAAGLELLGAGSYTLTDAGNHVDTLAADTVGSISFRDADDLLIGAVGGNSGINVGEVGGRITIQAGGDLAIEAGSELRTLTGVVAHVPPGPAVSSDITPGGALIAPFQQPVQRVEGEVDFDGAVGAGENFVITVQWDNAHTSRSSQNASIQVDWNSGVKLSSHSGGSDTWTIDHVNPTGVISFDVAFEYPAEYILHKAVVTAIITIETDASIDLRDQTGNLNFVSTVPINTPVEHDATLLPEMPTVFKLPSEPVATIRAVPRPEIRVDVPVINRTDEVQLRRETTVERGRELVLVKVGPDGTEIDSYPLPEDALADLAGLLERFKQEGVPDGLYRIDLKETGFPTRKLIEFYKSGQSIGDPVRESGPGSNTAPSGKDVSLNAPIPADQQTPQHDPPPLEPATRLAPPPATGESSPPLEPASDEDTTAAEHDSGRFVHPLIGAAALACAGWREQRARRRWTTTIDQALEDVEGRRFTPAARLRRRFQQ